MLVLALMTLLFTPGGVQATLSDNEKSFISVPNADKARESLQYITSEPHVAGTDGDLKMATYVFNQFKEAGLINVEFFNLTVGLNYPTDQPSLSMVDIDSGAVLFEAALSEDVLESDSTSDTWWRNHTFNGYAPSGDVTAQAVYANYGRPEDFDYLEANGIDVSGKIVITRYGQCFRGLKAMNAEARGAVATLIYSDPLDDGYDVGAVYPDGPWRPESSVQRGSAQFNSLCGGDPYRADPRYGDNATGQLCHVESPQNLIPSKPVLPISYGDATPILSALGGLAAPSNFTGGIKGLAYTLGPSQTFKLHLTTQHEDTVTPIWNIVATIQGSIDQAADQPVLMGNHRDAWVYGAADPNSGTAALIELARGFGSLLSQGWQPRKTIKLLSWSGEEYGLLGSTGYGELMADQLVNASVYLNTDVSTSGDSLEVSATPALSTLWKSVLMDLNDEIPSSEMQEEDIHVKEGSNTYLGVEIKNGPFGEVYDCNSDRLIASRSHQHTAEDPSGAIGTLGSGSDYAVFLDNLGIASLDFYFAPSQVGYAAQYGVYHSTYDSFDWINNWGGVDGEMGSSFNYMAAAAKVWGVLAMRLADDQFVPFDHFATTKALFSYLAQIQENMLPGMDLSGLLSATHLFQEASKKVAQDLADCDTSDVAAVQALNVRLGMTERQFLAEEGLPGRPWFKHILQAPGLYLGYAAQSYPGIQQAMDDKDLSLAQSQVDLAASRVTSAAQFLMGEN